MLKELLNTSTSQIGKRVEQDLKAYERAAAKEQFLSAYRPARETVENFLRRGKKFDVNIVQKTLADIADHISDDGVSVLCSKLRPYWKNEIRIPQSEDYPELIITAETERSLYIDFLRESGSIKNSVIRLAVQLYQNQDNYPLAILPPIIAFKKDIYSFEDWLDIPKRVADVLPLLTQS